MIIANSSVFFVWNQKAHPSGQ